MSKLNVKFPQILLSYVRSENCTLTSEDCNDLSKFVSCLEMKIEELKAENERLSKYVDENETRKLLEFKANLKRSIEVDPLAVYKEKMEDEG